METLTPEQEAQIAIIVEKWRAIALSTEPIDRHKATEAIKSAYALIGKGPSTEHIHVLRVPRDIRSAREAIRWVNWGIDPEEFSIQT